MQSRACYERALMTAWATMTIMRSAGRSPAKGWRQCLAAVAVAAAVIAAVAPNHGRARAEYVPYTPTPLAMVDRMLALAAVGPGDFLIDLGCGDGRILVAAARDYDARGLGVDIDEQRLVEAVALAKQAGVSDKVEFRNEDLFDTDISRASVLVLYLSLAIDIELRPKILQTMRPGSRVLSHHFNMGDWLPDKWEQVEGRMLYYWVVPASAAGGWQLTLDGGEGPRTMTLDLSQQFQYVKGSAIIGDRTVAVEEGRVTGERLRFVLEVGGGKRQAFEGRIADGRLEGEDWSAVRR